MKTPSCANDSSQSKSAFPTSDTNLISSSRTSASLRCCATSFFSETRSEGSTGAASARVVSSSSLCARTDVTKISTSASANWQYSAKSMNSTERVPLGRMVTRSSEQTSSAQSAPKLAATRMNSWTRMTKSFSSLASARSSKCFTHLQNLKNRRAIDVVFDSPLSALDAAGTTSVYAPKRSTYCRIFRPFSRTWQLLANLFAVSISNDASVIGTHNRPSPSYCSRKSVHISAAFCAPSSRSAEETRKQSSSTQ
mmetsp:Transcript_3025/g.8041  ORF Transcript_3025/g.8041 Transcript_3025/m.8041 type:complete len:253 (+) Transcript_3025:575-1333(+)